MLLVLQAVVEGTGDEASPPPQLEVLLVLQAVVEGTGDEANKDWRKVVSYLQSF